MNAMIIAVYTRKLKKRRLWAVINTMLLFEEEWQLTLLKGQIKVLTVLIMVSGEMEKGVYLLTVMGNSYCFLLTGAGLVDWALAFIFFLVRGRGCPLP